MTDNVFAACPRCDNLSATTPRAEALEVCVITEPTSAPVTAIEEVKPTVTLLAYVSIGFSGNLFLLPKLFN